MQSIMSIFVIQYPPKLNYILTIELAFGIKKAQTFLISTHTWNKNSRRMYFEYRKKTNSLQSMPEKCDYITNQMNKTYTVHQSLEY